MWLWGGVEYAGNAASVLGAWAAVAALIVWARQSSAMRVPPTGEQLDAAVDVLARRVEQVWIREVALRQLEDPRPLEVWWNDTARSLSDHRALIGAPLLCRTDDAVGLAAAFRRLPQRRLAILGPAGSGKTTLAVLLALALLRTRQPSEPVPVVLSLSSDLLGHSHLRTWLQQKIISEYPALRDTRAYGPDAVAELLASRRILPVLDGLDEIPSRYQARAFTIVNEALGDGSPLVLTCRTAAFEQAVTECRDVLNATAVIEPEPVAAETAADFLMLAAAPGSLQPGWQILAQCLRTEPRSPVALALRSPLNVSLVRLVYGPANPCGPDELTHAARFPDPDRIARHLLAEVVPALTARDAQHPRTPNRRRADHMPRWLSHLAAHMQSRGSYDFAWWELYRANPALSGTLPRAVLLAAAVFLIQALSDAADPQRWTNASLSESLAWLTLRPLPHTITVFMLACTAPWLYRITRRAGLFAPGAAMAAGCTAGIVYGGLYALVRIFLLEIPYYPPSYRWSVISRMAWGALPYTLTLLVAGAPRPPALPTQARLKMHGRGRQLLAELAAMPAAALGIALLFNVVPFLYLLPHIGFASVLGKISADTTPLLVGIVTATSLALLRFIRVPLATDGSATPESSLAADRRYAATLALIPATALMMLQSLLGAPQIVFFGSWRNVLAGAHAAGWMMLAMALIGSVLGFSTTSWGYFTAARLGLFMRKRLPLRTMAFLTEAHRLGILRRVGPVYQFRHALLQDHLAARPTEQGCMQGSSAPPSPAPGSAASSAADGLT